MAGQAVQPARCSGAARSRASSPRVLRCVRQRPGRRGQVRRSRLPRRPRRRGPQSPTTRRQVMDNAVAYNDGKVYSVAGYNGLANVAKGYVYDPAAQQWSPIADAPEALESPAAAFVDGKMYVVGGWNEAGNANTKAYVVRPSRQQLGPGRRTCPRRLAAPAATSLNGQLYVVGGCTTGNCAPTSKSAFRYDPSTNSWTAARRLPGGGGVPVMRRHRQRARVRRRHQRREQHRPEVDLHLRHRVGQLGSGRRHAL